MKSLMPRLLILTGYIAFLQTESSAQNCVQTSLAGTTTPLNGTIINLPCGQNCTNINFQTPHIKKTSDYIVSNIAYTPFPYLSASGLEDPILYADDQYSAIINLPFSFPFYDSIFTKMVVGSNGVATFDIANASCPNAWQITQQIPYGGNTICVAGTTYYPKASLMPAYSDLDPRTAASEPDRKIQWHVEGSPPCRKYVVSYYHVGVYGNNSCVPKTTFQMVMYESSGLIDVYFENKTCFSTTNAGRGILGIQDWSRTRAVAAPGKNNTTWTSVNEGYRFTPSAGASNYISSELVLLSNGQHVKWADTTTTIPGILDLSFANVCPTGNSTQYIVKTFFRSNTDTNALVWSFDTITINKTTNLNATATSTPTGCGPASGTITVTVPANLGTSPFVYILDAGAPQTDTSHTHTFINVAAGAHVVHVTDAAGCSSNVPVTVTLNNNLTVTATPNATSCTGVNNGSITVNPPTGTPPYQYSIGGPFQASNVFNNLAAGTYTVTVTDAGGCSGTTTVTVSVGPPISANTASTPTTCPGVNNGTITVTPTSGTAPYQYSLDGGAYQASNVFNNVAAGNHSVVVKDALGCTSNPLNVTVAAGAGVTGTATSTATSCNNASNGTITVTASNGTAPYQYSLDGGAYQASNIFNNVPAGNHNIVIKDAVGCISSAVPVTVSAGGALTAAITQTNVTCNGNSDGSFTVNVNPPGTAPFQYSLDNITFQASNVFSGLAAGNYTVYFKDNIGCTGTQTVTITQPAALGMNVTTQSVFCNGQSNGVITVNASGGVTPYQYSINGTTYQASNVFNVAAGTYTVYVKDNNGCIKSQSNIIITQPAILTLNAATQNASCSGGADGVITATAGGGTPSLQYSIDGVNFQASNIFNVMQGNYTVTVKDANNCLTTTNAIVGLNNTLTFTKGNDTTICEGTQAQLTVNSNATQYAWTPTTGLNNPAIANPTAMPTVTTQYTVTASLGVCNTSGTIKINVNPAPIANAGPNGDICFGQTYQLSGSGGVSYQWMPATYLSSTTVSNPVVSPSQTIQYSLQITDANGCKSLVSGTVTVNVTPPIKVTVTPKDSIVTEGDQIQLTATSIGTNYTWSNAGTLSNPNISNPVATMPMNSVGNIYTYIVTASTSAGCTGSATVTLRVYKGPDIYMVTAFTPNHDGKNDKFVPIPVGIKQIDYFRVYNRWGQLVFSTSKLYDGWDGTISGIDQPAGVYVWIVKGVTENGKIIFKRGTVTLVR